MPELAPGDWVYIDGFASEAGSISLPVRDRTGEFDEPLILACAHCVGALTSGYAQTKRVRGGSQALGLPGGRFDFDVGEVVRSVPRQPELWCEVDAALIRPQRGVTVTRKTHLGEIRRAVVDLSYELPTTNLEVWKVGARTGLTRGTLECRSYQYAFWNDRTARWTTHPEGYAIIGREGQPFANEGDSGAIVFDGERHVIGMLTGLLRTGAPGPYGPQLAEVTDDTLAYCIPIGLVLDQLAVTL